MTTYPEKRIDFHRQTLRTAFRAMHVHHASSAWQITGLILFLLIYIEISVMAWMHQETSMIVFALIAAPIALTAAVFPGFWLRREQVSRFTLHVWETCLLQQRCLHDDAWDTIITTRSLDDAPGLLDAQIAWKRLPRWQQRRILVKVEANMMEVL